MKTLSGMAQATDLSGLSAIRSSERANPGWQLIDLAAADAAETVLVSKPELCSPADSLTVLQRRIKSAKKHSPESAVLVRDSGQERDLACNPSFIRIFLLSKSRA